MSYRCISKTERGWNEPENFWVVSVFSTTPCSAAFIIHIDTRVCLRRITLHLQICYWLEDFNVLLYVCIIKPKLLHLISAQKLFVSPACVLGITFCACPCPQGPSCCHKETLHQRPDCVGSVAPVCVGMERICRRRGELRSWITVLCSSPSGWTFCAALYHSFCFHLCVRMARLCWFSWGSGLKASFLPLYFLCSSPW